MKVSVSAREERLAAALRENLKRRKARARAKPKDQGADDQAASSSRPNTAKKSD